MRAGVEPAMHDTRERVIRYRYKLVHSSQSSWRVAAPAHASSVKHPVFDHNDGKPEAALEQI
jgi:hypothetical protein